MKNLPKPKDYLLRVYELFVILIPGVIFSYVIVLMLETTGSDTLKKELYKWYSSDYMMLLAGLVSFAAGHIIAGIGSFLDHNEWWFFSKIYEHKQLRESHLLDSLLPVRQEFCNLRARALAVGREIFTLEKITEKNIRTWALFYIKNYGTTDVRSELEYLDANRRSVRNISVLFLIVSMCFKFWIKNMNKDLMEINIAMIVIVLLGCHRHQHLQWKCSESIFLHFIYTTCYRPGQDQLTDRFDKFDDNYPGSTSAN